jgi:hypothetical protein
MKLAGASAAAVATEDFPIVILDYSILNRVINDIDCAGISFRTVDHSMHSDMSLPGVKAWAIGSPLTKA